jgi:hypothetical protein
MRSSVGFSGSRWNPKLHAVTFDVWVFDPFSFVGNAFKVQAVSFADYQHQLEYLLSQTHLAFHTFGDHAFPGNFLDGIS